MFCGFTKTKKNLLKNVKQKWAAFNHIEII